MTTINSFDPAVINDVNIFGGISKWSIPALWMEDTTKVEETFKKHDLPIEKYLLKPTPKIIMERACEWVARTKAASDDSFSLTHKKLGETTLAKGGGIYKFGILKFVKDKAKIDLALNTESFILLHKDSGNLEFNGEYADDLRRAYDKFKFSYTADDIRGFCKDILYEYAVGIQFHGGVYFNPKSQLSKIKNLHEALLELQTQGIFFIRCFNGPELGVVGECFSEEMERKVKDITDKIEKCTVRKSALIGKQSNISEANAMLEMYKEIIGDESKLADIHNKLSGLSNKITQKVAELMTAVETE